MSGESGPIIPGLSLKTRLRNRLKDLYHTVIHRVESEEHWSGIFIADRFGPNVSFTFDDGPRPPFTEDISRFMRARGIPATFFFTGHRVEKFPFSVRQVDQDGHVIGNHSFSHPRLENMKDREIAREIDLTRAAIDLTLRDRYPNGYPLRYFRPPGGVPWTRDGTTKDRAQLMKILNDRNMDLVMWQVDSSDWTFPNPSDICQAVWDNLLAEQGGVLLFHDGYDNIFPALEEIIATLKDKGFSFHTLADLLKLRR